MRDQEVLTYVPAAPSQLGESGEIEDKIHDSGAADDPPHGSIHGFEPYNMRGLPRLDSSATAKGNVLDSDTPNLSAAIASKIRSKWLHAIMVEFKTITSMNTWMDSPSQPLGSKSYPPVVILRIKRNDYGNI